MMAKHGVKLKKIHFSLRTMTNEEKAKEIAKLHELTYYVYHKGCDIYEESSVEECYGSALQMAEWKDKQLYNELLELSFSSNPHDYMMWVGKKKDELKEQLKINSNEKTT